MRGKGKMDAALVGYLSLPILFTLLFLRVYAGIALFATGFLGYWLITGSLQNAVRILSTQPYAVTASFTMAVLPLFMVMGVVAGLSGFADDAYDAAKKWIGGLRGGLSIATTGANALFGAACGTTVASVAIFTKFSLPEMRKAGYNLPFAVASIASAGALAMLIPPSVLMIIYGMLTEQSVGKLFMAGVFPGLLLAALLSIGIFTMAKLNPKLAPKINVTYTWKDRLFSLRKVWGIAILAVIVLGGIYSGVFTPEEAAAVGALAAIVIAFILKRVTGKSIRDTFREAVQINAMIFLIFSGAQLYSRFIALSGIPASIGDWIIASNFHPMMVLTVFLLVYLILGCLMDSISMMTITLPIFYPIALSMGWDPIWFCIVVILIEECGLLTPPVGLSVFTAKAVAGADVKLEELFKAVIPFFAITLLTIAIVIAFPGIATWLPQIMAK